MKDFQFSQNWDNFIMYTELSTKVMTLKYFRIFS